MNWIQYRLLRRELVALAKKYGTKVTIRSYPIKYPDSYGVSGTHSSLHRRIAIKVVGKQSYLSILATLAHEVRHAEHRHKGMFSNYYQEKYEQPDFIKNLGSKAEDELPSIAISLRAENDCNRFARRWLHHKGFPLDPTKRTYKSFFEPYPLYNSFAHILHRKRQLEIKKAPFKVYEKVS